MYRSLASAALLGAAYAAHDRQTFAVMRFNGKEIFNGLVDPIVNPGVESPHEHTVFGGSNFDKNANGKTLLESSCTSAKVKGDKSAYWMPRIYFHDEDSDAFEPVPVLYTNVYYFFDESDDDIEAFPVGLSMLSGDTDSRTVPSGGGKPNLNSNTGDINSVFFTCARDSHSPASWPEDSDGSTCGVATPGSGDHQGVGFPLQKCDAMASPLRADVNFPSCYNPDKDVTDYENNMVYPKAEGSKQNCPEGYIHVPRLLFEIYWDTQQFDDRWTPDGKTQPFVLSNGDVTGYSLHADFMAAWDQDVLQKIIDSCDVQHADMDTCPGIESESNKDECECTGDIVNMRTAITKSTKALPGSNPLSGFQYGERKTTHGSSSDSDSDSSDDLLSDIAMPGNASQEDTEEDVDATEVEDDSTYEEDAGSEEEADPVGEEAETGSSEPQDAVTDFPAFPEPTKGSMCGTRTKTVVETVTVWDDAVETQAAKVKRHVHRHARRHH